MATFTQEEHSTSQARPTRPPAPGGDGKWIVAAIALMGLFGAVAYGAYQFVGDEESDVVLRLTHTVEKGDLLITVTEDGNLESAVNLDIKCQVAGGSSILWIVEDGKEVKKGDKLVELDKSALEEQISQQTITYEKARSAKVQAEKDYEVAKISVEEYLEGTFKIELQDADAQITIAEENLRSSKNGLGHSQRMFRRGYISSLELESQQFAVQRAQLELDSASTSKEVLEKFSKVKMLEDLRSQVITAQAKMESEKAAFDLELQRLTRLKDQLENCLIMAPQDGMVVYANDAGRGRFGSSSGPQIEEGAQIRERQNILRLPDLNEMQVKVNVHETKVDSLARGMRAEIKIQDQLYQGTVMAIANQPEAGSWFSGSVKEYAATTRIEGEATGLKPGMTAEVEILIAHLEDVITLPVAAIVEQRGKFYCWAVQNNEPVRRPLVLGLSNDRFVHIKDGVNVGEAVLLNPRAVVEETAGGDEGESEESQSVEERFGSGGPAASDASEPRGGGGRPGGGQEAGRGGGQGGGRRDGGGGQGRGGGGQGWGGGGRGMMQYDANKDGQISKDEVPEFMKNFFDSMDADGDGNITAEEIAARGGGGRGGAGGGMDMMQHDANKDGKVSKDEAPEFMKSFFDRMDGNGDGELDEAEITEARSRFSGGGGR